MMRRIIWLIILLMIAYFIYRAIDPVGAEALIAKIQSFTTKDAPENNGIQEEVIDELEPTIQEDQEDEIIQTGNAIDTTNTGLDQELQGILTDTGTQDQIATGTEDKEKPITNPKPTPKPKTTTTTTTTQTQPNSLSQQDMDDLKAFLNAIVE